MSEPKFFNKIKLSELKDIKISAINVYKDYLIIGDTEGNIQTYEINSKNKINEIGKINIKNKIDLISKSPNRNICYVLSSGEVLSLNLPTLNNKTQLIKTGIEKLYINPYNKENENQILTINKKKKLKVHNVDIVQTQVSLSDTKMKEIAIEEIPNCALWFDNIFIYTNISNTYWLYLNTGKTIPVELGGITQILNFGDKIGLSSGELTIFMRNGKTIPYPPISQGMKDFISFAQIKNYLIGLNKNCINIFKKGETCCELIETINLYKNEGIGKYISSSENRIIIFTDDGNKNNSIFDLKEKPYEDQVNNLIEKKQYNAALEIIIDNIPEENEKKPDIMEQFYLDCAFICIKDEQKDYDLAIKYLNLANFNPFEIIYMFYECLNIKIIHMDKKSDIIEHKNENQLIDEKSIDSEESKKILAFLINILYIKRDYILDKSKLFSNNDNYFNEKISFLSSKYGKINLSNSKLDITIKQTLDIINSVLIKCMIKLQKNYRDIQSILDNKSINFQIFDDFLQDKFFLDEKNKNLDETKFIMAYINEKKENYEEALKVWKYFGTRNIPNDKYLLVGRERTKKIFFKFKENKTINSETKQALFRKYISWLLLKYQNEAFEIMLKTEIVNVKVFLDEIIPEIEKEKGESGSLKEKFLEYCNQYNKNEEYQTQLLLLYLNKMFSYIPKEKKDVNNENTLQGDLKKYYDLFLKIIQEPDSCYNKRTILEYIENSWLKIPKIYLYSQLKEHDKALNELFNDAKINHNFEEIEKYCKENIESMSNIFEIYYKLLSDLVKNDYQDNIDKKSEEIDKLEKKLISSTQENITESEKTEINNEILKLKEEIKNINEMKKPYEDEMLRILKNYGSIQNLDPLFALNYANEHINVCENNDFFNYLTNVITEFTEERNKYRIAKNLSKMASIYKEKETLDFKKKHILVNSDKICGLCNKKIGNMLFVVYPNLKIYHSRCIQNISIDPVTGVDFSKKKCIK